MDPTPASASVDDAPPAADGRRLRYRDLRLRLLDGTIDYILEHGVASLTMRPLAQALGVAPAALVNHFGSKDGLIDAVLLRLREASIAASARREQDFPATEGFEPYGRWYATWTDPSVFPAIRLIFEIYVIGFRDPDRHGDALRRTVEDWLGLLERYLASVGCPEDERTDLASLMFAVMTGMQVDLLATGDHDRVDRAHERFVALLESRRRDWAA